MLRYYLNEDLFIVEFKQVKGEDAYEVTLCEVDDRWPKTPPSAISSNL